MGERRTNKSWRAGWESRTMWTCKSASKYEANCVIEAVAICNVETGKKLQMKHNPPNAGLSFETSSGLRQERGVVTVGTVAPASLEVLSI